MTSAPGRPGGGGPTGCARSGAGVVQVRPGRTLGLEHRIGPRAARRAPGRGDGARAGCPARRRPVRAAAGTAGPAACRRRRSSPPRAGCRRRGRPRPAVRPRARRPPRGSSNAGSSRIRSSASGITAETRTSSIVAQVAREAVEPVALPRRAPPPPRPATAPARRPAPPAPTRRGRRTGGTACRSRPVPAARSPPAGSRSRAPRRGPAPPAAPAPGCAARRHAAGSPVPPRTASRRNRRNFLRIPCVDGRDSCLSSNGEISSG